MNNTSKPIRGLVLLQSLKNEMLLEALRPMMVDQHQYLLGGVMLVDVLVLSIQKESLHEALFTVAGILKAQSYYAHFIDGDYLYIVYPHCVCRMIRNDREAERYCQRIGRNLSIPETQMRFNDLFDKDHPNE